MVNLPNFKSELEQVTQGLCVAVVVEMSFYETLMSSEDLLLQP